jgi:adenosylcobinamide-GDP ribazoletransferase
LFALKSGFGWLSTIPVGISMEGIEALMRHLYVFPLVGLGLGAILGGAAFILSKAFPAALVSVLVLATIYKLCGINHLDGLGDFGDGVVAHGSLEKKVEAMKDVSLGTGGVAFIAIILLAQFAMIYSLSVVLLPLAMLVAEVCAKQSMIAFAAFSRSLQKGFGQIMIERTGHQEFLIGLFIAGAISYGVLGRLGLAMLVASQVASLYLVAVAKRNFGGATGDGIGATNEICRTVALATSLTLGGVLTWMPW